MFAEIIPVAEWLPFGKVDHFFSSFFGPFVNLVIYLWFLGRDLDSD